MKKIFVWLALLMVVALVVSVFGSVGSNKTDTGESGGNTVNPEVQWLFQNTSIFDAPSLTSEHIGVSFTLFVNDGSELVEIGTAVAGVHNDNVELSIQTDDFRGDSAGICFENGRWQSFGLDEWNCSLRINTVGGTGGGNTGGDTPAEPTVDWLFEYVVFDGDGKSHYRPTTEITRELKNGKSYTLFCNGEELATATASYDSGEQIMYICFEFMGIESMYTTWEGWHCTVPGTYSVRFNG